ncbi:grpE protein homolog 1, mitochondrial-like [Anneissia japonica]|uniref:grpE protein homolog 1, mitochondrial-like n=1 Tax=Anneissia japonica TaxID=1529436 RepID=UPI00142599B0|nr:grpE protein homolog 1, mitochondrial-like [Anneissia japonica]
MATTMNAHGITKLILLPRFCRISLQNSNAYRIQSLSSEAHEEKPAETVQKEDNTKPELSENEKKLAEEKAKLENDLKDTMDKYRRALAEVENTRTRYQKQLDDSRRFSIQDFCKDLLEVADILTKATESVPKEKINSNPHLKDLFQGVTMTETQLQKVFSRNKLFKIDPVGEKFDPNQHEALFESVVEGKEPGTVAVVTKVGYRLHDRTIRPALVGVAKAP